MPLNWRLSKIHDYEKLCWEPDPDAPNDPERNRLKPLTNSLIWATIPVGINQITEKNFEKFFLRLSAIEQVSGTFLNEIRDDKIVERPITLAEVKQHIGLWTNASSLTDAQFRGNLAQRAMREAQQRLKNAAE